MCARRDTVTVIYCIFTKYMYSILLDSRTRIHAHCAVFVTKYSCMCAYMCVFYVFEAVDFRGKVYSLCSERTGETSHPRCFKKTNTCINTNIPIRRRTHTHTQRENLHISISTIDKMYLSTSNAQVPEYVDACGNTAWRRENNLFKYLNLPVEIN